jgi:hypothetical protein
MPKLAMSNPAAINADRFMDFVSLFFGERLYKGFVGVRVQFPP